MTVNTVDVKDTSPVSVVSRRTSPSGQRHCQIKSAWSSLCPFWGFQGSKPCFVWLRPDKHGRRSWLNNKKILTYDFSLTMPPVSDGDRLLARIGAVPLCRPAGQTTVERPAARLSSPAPPLRLRRPSSKQTAILRSFQAPCYTQIFP